VKEKASRKGKKQELRFWKSGVQKFAIRFRRYASGRAIPIMWKKKKKTALVCTVMSYSPS
jgi:hypothetical protein